MITEISGNIFDSKCQTLVNTVNCEGVMGRGIALEYKYRFPKMFDQYYDICMNGLLKTGSLLLWTGSEPWILNFPTKFRWKQPSKIEYIEDGLNKFVSSYKRKNISSIAFPQLGVSLGGLNESVVSELFYKYLSPLEDLDIELYNFDPSIIENLVAKFNQKVQSFDENDYRNQIGLRTNEISAIMNAIKSNSIRSMTDFQSLKGIGEKSIRKIHNFLSNGNSTNNGGNIDVQLRLF